jgi:hypothetical protein
MTPLAVGFLVASWTGVLGLTVWCFHRVLKAGRHGGPDDGPGDGEDT